MSGKMGGGGGKKKGLPIAAASERGRGVEGTSAREAKRRWRGNCLFPGKRGGEKEKNATEGGKRVSLQLRKKEKRRAVSPLRGGDSLAFPLLFRKKGGGEGGGKGGVWG